MALHARTALRVLYDLLVTAGYCDTQVQFAELLRIKPNNVASYLAAPSARYRVSPRLDTLLCWAWALSRETALEVSLRVEPCGEVLWHVTGWDARGQPFPPQQLQTSFREHEARPLVSWRADWQAYLSEQRDRHAAQQEATRDSQGQVSLVPQADDLSFEA